MAKRPPVRTHQQHVQRITAALDAGYRHSPGEMLRWMLSSIMTLWGLPDWDKPPAEMEAQIATAIDAYADAVAGCEPFEDILGPAYMTMASSGRKDQLGQFFTPWPIAMMMAAMVGHDSGPLPEDRLLTACDPCSGSGVMMLALCNQVLRTQGPSALRCWSITCCDLDSICAAMSTVQLLSNANLHDVQLGEVLVLRGNSLAPWDGLDVVAHAYAPELKQAPPPALQPERLAALAGAARCHPDAREQLSLFDFGEIAA